ncbi:MAG: Asp23/Gls24 family envelope stress response protein [Clostridiales Family XIII bacterium]|jgi:uncharacterized alkaline shock family protein YloU|nr:Asp23/Gls24 family envelope stress response protein [Clostridiales Family XIII bacterium]
MDNNEGGVLAQESLDAELAAVHVSQETISVWAAEAALSVEGVIAIGMHNAAQKKGRRPRVDTKAYGVRVTEDAAAGYTVDIYLVVRFGAKIPEVAWNVQKRVTQGLKEASDIKLKEVNIHIQGVKAD